MTGASFWRSASAVERHPLAGEPVDAATSGLSAREWRELAATLGISNIGTSTRAPTIGNSA